MFDLHLIVHHAFVLFCFQLKQLQAAGGVAVASTTAVRVLLFYSAMYVYIMYICVCMANSYTCVCMHVCIHCVCVCERERERGSVCVCDKMSAAYPYVFVSAVGSYEEHHK